MSNRTEPDADVEGRRRLIHSFSSLQGDDLVRAIMLLKVLKAYATLVLNNLATVNHSERIRWLEPLFLNKFQEDPQDVSNLLFSPEVFRYRCRMKPLFAFNIREVFGITEAQIIAFLILSAENGIV